MAEIKLIIPDDQLFRIYDAFAVTYRFNPKGTETKESFMQRQLAEFIQRTVSTTEETIAIQTARKHALDKVKIEIPVGYPTKEATPAEGVNP